MKNQIISIVISIVATALSYGIGYAVGWTTEINWLEAFAVFTSYWCTVLCVYQSRSNYLIGAVSVAALGLLFWQQALYSSMALQIWLFPAMLYGWLRWGPDLDTRPVTTLAFNWTLLMYAGVTGVVYAACYYINNAMGGTMAYLDASILVLSILAQFLLDNKKLENWYIWILVDIISVYEYSTTGLYIVAMQMGLFILNAGWGYYEWKQTQINKG